MTGNELRQRRERLLLTQEELADLLGTTSNNLSRWERGISAVPLTIDRLLPYIESDPNVQGSVSERLHALMRRRTANTPPAPVPSASDVLALMRTEGIGQDEAVRRLGGQP